MAQVTNTRQVVVDYVRYRLQQRGLPWPNGPDPGPSPGRVERTMRALGEEFQERYTQVFQEMCKQLDIRPNNAEQTFITTVSELFRDGVKWGRIVALFAFSGSLAVECVEKEMPLLVDQVVDWTENYIDTHLHSWIQQNGNWVRVVTPCHFFKREIFRLYLFGVLFCC